MTDFGLSLNAAASVPLAEETGLIVPIGKWVLNIACAQNAAWQREGLPPLLMAVNLPARQFADEDLLQDIAAALKDSAMKPELLELELTGRMMVQNADRAGKVLAAIKQLGARLAIDDFGSATRRSRTSSASRSTRSRWTALSSGLQCGR